MKKAKWLGLALLLALSSCSANVGGTARFTSAAKPESVNNNPSESKKYIAIASSSLKPEYVRQLEALPSPPSAPIPERKLTGKPTIEVKGIYVSAWKARGNSLEQLIRLVNDTELNAMVIDVKNDSGQITYDSQVALANEIGSDDTNPIADIRALLKRLKDNNIYTIARVVVFKDPYLSSARNDLAMQTKSGAVWRDKKGVAWVDPYHPAVQAYNLDVAKEAAKLGFDEIQFDYVRFPENGKKVDREVRFRNPQNISKADLITGFLQQAKTSMPNIPISADVFGLTPSITDDMGIGQDWNRISPVIDTISPMIYPSHYSDGALGISFPDLQPYAVISRALKDAINKNTQLQQQQKSAARVRPWLQDFTARWVKNHQTYGMKQIREQIKAVKELGIDQYLLWNPSSTYSYREL